MVRVLNCPKCGAGENSENPPWLSRSGWVCPNCCTSEEIHDALFHKCRDGVVRMLLVEKDEQSFNCSICASIVKTNQKQYIAPIYNPNVF